MRFTFTEEDMIGCSVFAFHEVAFERVVGYFDLALPRFQVILRGCMLYRSGDQTAITTPNPSLDISVESKRTFNKAVLRALQAFLEESLDYHKKPRSKDDRHDISALGKVLDIVRGNGVEV